MTTLFEIFYNMLLVFVKETLFCHLFYLTRRQLKDAKRITDVNGRVSIFLLCVLSADVTVCLVLMLLCIWCSCYCVFGAHVTVYLVLMLLCIWY